ncbi:hypothetical protein COOONC_06050 [Cooperia oncophora]
MMDRCYMENRRLRETCAALQQEIDDCGSAPEEERLKIRDLCRAVPSLPKPEQVYDKIVACCREFHECTRRMSSLDQRIRNLRTSTTHSTDWTERFHELELTEVLCDRMRLEFLLVRCQMRTLFSVPPLLVATGEEPQAIWKTWMPKEQLSDEDDPLLIEPDILEAAIADQLQILDGHRFTRELRISLREEHRKSVRTFQYIVTESLQRLQSSIEALMLQEKNNIEMAQPPPIPEQEAQVEEESVPREAQEQELIRENANQGNARRNEIEEEIRLRQAEIEFQQAIESLEAQQTCPPTRLDRGEVQLEEERHMRCAFCEAMGAHYTDSCHVVRSVQQRRDLVAERRLCIRCLKYCSGDQFCKNALQNVTIAVRLARTLFSVLFERRPYNGSATLHGKIGVTAPREKVTRGGKRATGTS